MCLAVSTQCGRVTDKQTDILRQQSPRGNMTISEPARRKYRQKYFQDFQVVKHFFEFGPDVTFALMCFSIMAHNDVDNDVKFRTGNRRICVLSTNQRSKCLRKTTPTY